MNCPQHSRQLRRSVAGLIKARLMTWELEDGPHLGSVLESLLHLLSRVGADRFPGEPVDLEAHSEHLGHRHAAALALQVRPRSTPCFSAFSTDDAAAATHPLPRSTTLSDMYLSGMKSRSTYRSPAARGSIKGYDSNATAIAGCEGVFHFASPVPAVKVLHPEEVIAPAVTGTLNVLNAACSEAKVKRVVVVSSLAAAIIRPDSPEGAIVDEDCWSDEEYCRKTENWYSLSKTLAEREALDFAEKHGLSVVTLCPCLVIGPLLQPTVNASCLFLINLLKGTRESLEYKIICVVDVRDVADALLLMYEKPEASDRYFCAPYALKSLDLVDMLKKLCPNYKCPER